MTQIIKAIICSVLTAQLLCSCNIQMVNNISESQTLEVRQNEELQPEAEPEFSPEEQDAKKTV